MAIDRIIEHNHRTGFGSLCQGGLRMAFPMRLFRKGNKKFWNPEDIDFTRDAEDLAAMTEDERLITCVLAAQFMAGEEPVTQDIRPLMRAMAGPTTRSSTWSSRRRCTRCWTTRRRRRRSAPR